MSLLCLYKINYCIINFLFCICKKEEEKLYKHKRLLVFEILKINFYCVVLRHLIPVISTLNSLSKINKQGSHYLFKKSSITTYLSTQRTFQWNSLQVLLVCSVLVEHRKPTFGTITGIISSVSVFISTTKSVPTAHIPNPRPSRQNLYINQESKCFR